MEKYLQYFYEIAEIPHGSGNTKHISDYLVQFAKAHGLYVRRDELNNVIIIKEAHPECAGSKPVILQGHIDMVAVKEDSISKDMTSEGLELYEDGEYLRARGTSLGGDDGIAVAYMLALLDGDYKAPRLECIFTTDEEVGMIGAHGLSVSDITGARMINLDQEEEGVFITGCAGGVRADIMLPVNKEIERGPVFDIMVSNLKGGHSGIDIGKNRGNAIRLLIDELCKLNNKIGINLISIDGGDADNAIPSSAGAEFMLTGISNTVQNISEIHKIDGKTVKLGLPGDEDEARFELIQLSDDEMIVLDTVSTMDLLDTISNIPNGVLGVSDADANMIETSMNMGVIKTDEDDVKISILVRSIQDEAKEKITDDLCKLIESYGGQCTLHGDYPGWKPVDNSSLCEIMARIYEEKYLCKPKIETIHAGLEGGVFTNKIKGLDCISIGPDIPNVHTCNEALSLPSAKRVFDYLVALLACL